MASLRANQRTLGLICLLLAGCGGGTAKKEQLPPTQPGPDPLYSSQWHLDAINVAPVWGYFDDHACLGGEEGLRGEGVRIAIVDDGLEIRHPDLWPNWAPGENLNFLTRDWKKRWDPTPADPADSHGTSVAGLAAARDCNSEGGRGVAPRAQLVGYNLLKNWTLENEIDAMTHNQARVAVSNNSWGARDGTGQLQPAGITWRSAIESGLAYGRNGLGTVYVWAAGNRGDIDNSNYDGRANYHGVMAIGAVDHEGQKAHYSEEGANLWLVAPGGHIHTDPRNYCIFSLITTDLTGPAGLNSGAKPYDLDNPNYTRCMAGTSASTPLVSGVAALVLQARPELTWRDVRLVLAESARRDGLGADDWTTAGVGYHGGISHSHKYGFGLVDAEKAVALARAWTPLPPLDEIPLDPVPVEASIPRGNPEGISRSINISGSQIDFIEWIDIYFSSNYSNSGNLEITLTSPVNTVSRLALPRNCDQTNAKCTLAITGENGDWTWRFGSARHLGESADGLWTLKVVSTANDTENDGGDWLSWKLIFRGHTREL